MKRAVTSDRGGGGFDKLCEPGSDAYAPMLLPESPTLFIGQTFFTRLFSFPLAFSLSTRFFELLLYLRDGTE